MDRSRVRTPWLAVLVLAAGLTPLDAQLIQLKTVPLATGEQFLLFPSTTLAMGGLTLAVDDPLGDHWTNPAQGVRIAEPLLIGSPTFYSIGSNGGAGRSFPVAALFRGDRWFGGVGFALQQVVNESGRQDWIWPLTDVLWLGEPTRLSDASTRNVFAQGFLGTRLGDGPWSFGIGLSAAALDAVDGVDLLYANAERIDQHGTLGDVRLGLYRDGSRDRLSLLLLHDRVSMTHDVTYLEFQWDTVSYMQTVTRRVDENLDRTRTWGVQAAYDRDLDAPGWRVGGSATVNRKAHPKIPNYEIQNIPRDPGTTWAYELGVGLSRTRGPTEFGIDLLFQPIWSDTWQEAAANVPTVGGGVIPRGGRTIENDFFFTNVVLRAGLSHDLGRATVQGGLELRSYDYSLDQRDHVAGTFRDQDEAWMEWSPSAGATFRFSDVVVRYAGRITTGTGQPGVELTPVAMAEQAALADFIVAPRGPLTLQEAMVMTHQLSVSIPIR
jgi:hypothetical protein